MRSLPPPRDMKEQHSPFADAGETVYRAAPRSHFTRHTRISSVFFNLLTHYRANV